MKRFTKNRSENLRAWALRHPKTAQWGWFMLLWLAGLCAALALAAPIKLLFRFLK